MSDTALTTIQPQAIDRGEFKKTHTELVKFVKSQLRESTDIKGGKSGDYGIIPFTKKKSLLKPGAEKLLKLFGFSAHMELVKEIEDFDKSFVFYKYRCVITHAATGTYIADAVRSCNNKERKHIDKNIYDAANTIEAVAQKRALVAATVQATMASEIFDADVSENDSEAPNKPITKEDDPRRVQLTMRLYGIAKEHGWTNIWIHAAIKKRWQKESLTEISNEQLEELTEFITTTYMPVKPNEKPVLREKVPVEPPVTIVDRGEVKVVRSLDLKTDKGEHVAVDHTQSDEKLSEDEEREQLKAEAEEGDVLPESFCRTCNKSPLPSEETFCSKECEEKYFEGVQQPSKALRNNFTFDRLLKKENAK